MSTFAQTHTSFSFSSEATESIFTFCTPPTRPPTASLLRLYYAAGLFFLPPSWADLAGAASVLPNPPSTLTPSCFSTTAYGGPPNQNITVAFLFSSLFSAFSTLISARASLYMRWSRASWAFNCCTSFVLLCSRCASAVSLSALAELNKSAKDAMPLGQGAVYWQPPGQALEKVKQIAWEISSSRYGTHEGLPELREALVEKLCQENKLSKSSVMVTAGSNQTIENDPKQVTQLDLNQPSHRRTTPLRLTLPPDLNTYLHNSNTRECPPLNFGSEYPDQGFLNLVLALCHVVDSVVLFAPYFFNAYMSFKMTGINNILVGPSDPMTLLPDADWLEKTLSETKPVPKLVSIVNPGNPSGTCIPEPLLKGTILAVAGGGSASIKLWDTAEWKLITSLSIPRPEGLKPSDKSGNKKFVLSVAWSPDGKRLACGSIDGTISIFDVSRAKFLHHLEGHCMPVCESLCHRVERVSEFVDVLIRRSSFI
ncbi:hypothetical protein TEA_005698 [Camellia sinensis var. sinensis]|uniref:Anaphase-promoting complex subunit 4-like WD40 domain-containing protein n=1 Tax=Camellia sinensis var. sinensis TaxID=542762 RepID=A0A4S4DJH6_CAMSN|nr:hypothetical protein TEA_005698 [Camellia sinensis var. sinensis]